MVTTVRDRPSVVLIRKMADHLPHGLLLHSAIQSVRATKMSRYSARVPPPPDSAGSEASRARNAADARRSQPRTAPHTKTVLSRSQTIQRGREHANKLGLTLQVGRHYLTVGGQIALVDLVGVPDGVNAIVIAKRREQLPTSRLQFHPDLFDGKRHIHHQSPFALGYEARAQATSSSLAPLLTRAPRCSLLLGSVPLSARRLLQQAPGFGARGTQGISSFDFCCPACA
jgi:hypothetical protein